MSDLDGWFFLPIKLQRLLQTRINAGELLPECLGSCFSVNPAGKILHYSGSGGKELILLKNAEDDKRKMHTQMLT